MASSNPADRAYNFAEAKADAASRGVKWVRACLDDLRVKYHENGVHSFVQGYPAKGTDSFCVFPNGTWKDFNGGEAGDLVALAQLVQPWSALEALQWLYGRLGKAPAFGGKRLSDAEIAARDEEARQRKAADDAAKAAQEDKDAKRYGSRYVALPFAQGTIVQRYYEAHRGVIFGPDGLDHLTRTLRFEDDALYKYPDGAEELLPAQIAPYFKGGRVVGLHRTYLRRDGLAKAYCGLDDKGKPLPVKKNLGKKGIIPLYKGDGNLSVGDAIRKKHQTVLVISEGIEDGVVAAYYRPDYRVWATGDKGGLTAFGWPEIASGVIVLIDNDGSTEAEQERAFAKVKAHWEAEAQGRPLKFFRSQIGKDITDWHTK